MNSSRLVIYKHALLHFQEMGGITGSDSRNMSVKQCSVLETALVKIKVNMEFVSLLRRFSYGLSCTPPKQM